nr:hypothetical protein [uncultured Celeribacter sp.]
MSIFIKLVQPAHFKDRALPLYVRHWKRVLFRTPNEMYTRNASNITFYSPHPILDQVASDILAGLPDGMRFKRDVCVFVGVHFEFGRLWRLPGFKIAVQTEHLFDAEGDQIYGRRQTFPKNSRVTEFRLHQALRFSDAMLDFSENSRPFYEQRFGANPTVWKKLHFGPHIFPASAVPFLRGEGKPLFYGSVKGNTRRKVVLDKLQNVRILPEEIFGEVLSEEIRKAPTVVNVHNGEGVYTEAPRLLSAYLHGKPVLSERLDDIFIPGEDYALIGQEGIGWDTVFDNFSRKVVQNYAFKSFVEKALAQSG